MHTPLSDEERRAILERLPRLDAEYNELARQLADLEESGEDGSGTGPLREQLADIAKEAAGLLRRYTDSLPERPLSRCPFSGQILSLVIDDRGLDGLWWNHHAPKRPPGRLPATFFALDGALKLEEKPEKAPFLCAPGPDVPFVLPRLLQFTQVRAVVSSLKIGPHTAYPIVYYADPMLYGEKRVNDWGTDRYWEEGNLLPGVFGPGEYISLTPDPEEYDFDLKPWIRRGKLLWIAPGDQRLVLHGHATGCPYLDLPGSRRLKYIQNGEVWEDDPEYETMDENDPAFDLEHFRRLVERYEKGEV